MKRIVILKFIASIVGGMLLFYGFGGLFILFIEIGNHNSLTTWQYILPFPAYVVGVIGFHFISDNKNWKITVPTGILLPAGIIGIYFLTALLIDNLFEMGPKEPIIYAAIPSTVIILMTFRFLRKKWLKQST